MPAGPGNPYARQVASLRCALLAAVTEEDIQAVAQAMIAKAKEGNPAAAKLLFQYVLGKPSETVDPAIPWICRSSS
jgi:ABC-type Fe3+ transport system substrate-binding protein